MSTRVRLLGGMAGVAIAARSRTPAPEAPAAVLSWQQPREVMERFVDLLYRRRQVRAAFESCVAGAGYRDHDPSHPSGRQAAIELLARKLADPAFEVEVERVFLDGDRAVVHTWVGPAGRRSQRLDLFRIDGGRIVEHWGFNEGLIAPPDAEPEPPGAP